MVIVKADKDSEAGVLPSTELLTEMMKYNEQLVKAGVMVSGRRAACQLEGGASQVFADGKTTVTDGPFAETKELIAGFWIFEVKSKQEAIDWVRRASHAGHGNRDPPDLRTPEDFGDNLTPSLKAKEEQLRAQAAGKK